jgi:hypothetical protein
MSNATRAHASEANGTTVDVFDAAYLDVVGAEMDAEAAALEGELA